jgi:hypothetical protein
MAITTGSTWRWQMLMPHADTSHERLWRQVLRWLTAASPNPVEVTLERESYCPGDTVTVRVRVADRTYSPVNDATVRLKVTDPTGNTRDIRMTREIGEAGLYAETFTVPVEGVFRLDVSSSTASGDFPETALNFLVSGFSPEYTDAGMNASLLKEIARASGGKFYTQEDVNQLTNDLLNHQKTVTVKTEKDIWDMPLVLLLLLAFFSIEWLIRRQKGMS